MPSRQAENKDHCETTMAFNKGIQQRHSTKRQSTKPFNKEIRQRHSTKALNTDIQHHSPTTSNTDIRQRHSTKAFNRDTHERQSTKALNTDIQHHSTMAFNKYNQHHNRQSTQCNKRVHFHEKYAFMKCTLS
jgi:uncharacterized protein YaaN involved in tellurite resistance